MAAIQVTQRCTTCGATAVPLGVETCVRCQPPAPPGWPLRHLRRAGAVSATAALAVVTAVLGGLVEH